ncbi:MAG: hypothetical protein ACREML_09615 [Vulcanimicrobiaceae bacterium]
MIVTTEALWLRAVKAVSVRGLLPDNASSLTPRELGDEVARRGDERLLQLAISWYYPASYGHVRGQLSNEEAMRLVVALESENVLAEAGPEQGVPPPAKIPRSRLKAKSCDLCGLPVMDRVAAGF